MQETTPGSEVCPHPENDTSSVVNVIFSLVPDLFVLSCNLMTIGVGKTAQADPGPASLE